MACDRESARCEPFLIDHELPTEAQRDFAPHGSFAEFIIDDGRARDAKLFSARPMSDLQIFLTRLAEASADSKFKFW